MRKGNSLCEDKREAGVSQEPCLFGWTVGWEVRRVPHAGEEEPWISCRAVWLFSWDGRGATEGF